MDCNVRIPLLNEMTLELRNSGSSGKIQFTGWIPDDGLSRYINELKLIILPSYTEGGVLATIKEAMVCGTFSSVTRPAGVQMIRDGENGFVLEDNSPESIARKVLQVLKHPNSDKVLTNARNLAEEFSYEKVVARYQHIPYGEIRQACNLVSQND